MLERIPKRFLVYLLCKLVIKMKYELQETIIVVYEIEAESMDEALNKGFELNDNDRIFENTQGFTYIREIETGKDRIL